MAVFPGGCELFPTLRADTQPRCVLPVLQVWVSMIPRHPALLRAKLFPAPSCVLRKQSAAVGADVHVFIFPDDLFQHGIYPPYCVELKKEPAEKLKKYPKFIEVFPVSAEVFHTRSCSGFHVPDSEKPLKSWVFQHNQRFLLVPCCVGIALSYPRPLCFAKINARGGGGLLNASPQRSDPPPRGPQKVQICAPSHEMAYAILFSQNRYSGS